MESQSLTKLFGAIIIVSISYLLTVYSIAGSELLSLTYEELFKQDPSIAIKLVVITLFSLGIVAFLADYYFSKGLQEDRLLSDILKKMLKINWLL